MTAPSWFFRFNQKFHPLFTICLFFPSLFSFIIDNYNYGSLLRKCLKMKIFLLFTIVYSKSNVALAIICQHTMEKIQISFGKILGICRVPRRISKADFKTGYWKLSIKSHFLLLYCMVNSSVIYVYLSYKFRFFEVF